MEKTPISVYPATLMHLPALADLFNQYRVFYQQSSDLEGAAAFLRQRFLQQDSRILVAEMGGQLIGFLQIYPSLSSVAMQPIWILNDLYVDPAYRRQGVARELMRAAQEQGVKIKIARMELSTQMSNLSAKKLYQSLGFVQDNEFEHFVLPL